jgi:hypothetical protein
LTTSSDLGAEDEQEENTPPLEKTTKMKTK